MKKYLNIRLKGKSYNAGKARYDANSILEKHGLQPEECLMVGNDVSEDMSAELCGMKVFLLTDCLINSDNKDLSCYKQGTFDDLLDYIKTLI